jgi:hypothetical protein
VVGFQLVTLKQSLNDCVASFRLLPTVSCVASISSVGILRIISACQSNERGKEFERGSAVHAKRSVVR